MSQIVPPLAAVLADLPDFRDPRGVRHPLRAVPLLSCVAMLCGARGESAIAKLAENYGATWCTPLGFTRPDGPSQSTVQRFFGASTATCWKPGWDSVPRRSLPIAPHPLTRR